jgi:uncharacterized membrane protein YedE/YeeE
VRARLAALVLGVPFGFTIAWGGMNDPQVIRRMLLLQSVYLYKMFALGVFVGLVGSLLLRRRRPRALVTRQPVEWERARPERRHVVGSLIFGCGWSISSSCPGPIATQLATGLWWSGFTIVGIGGGIVLFFAAQDRKARSAATDAVPELAVPG